MTFIARQEPIKWTEKNIAAALATGDQGFKRKYLCVVPNCSWTGSECDLLVITENLRIIDVEIKISRSDLKVDAKKTKWQHGFDPELDGGYGNWGKHTPRKREWPSKVWKHYYAMPADIWDDRLFECMPTQNSGVLLMHHRHGKIYPVVRRIAKPCRDAEQISAANAIDVARLASLRMWDAYRRLGDAL